jgi:hypothetical protein
VRRADVFDMRCAGLLELLDVLELHGQLLPDVQHVFDLRRADDSE